jgi:hypothetical protein
MTMTIETIKVEFEGGYSALIKIEHDEDCENPNDLGQETVFNASRGSDLVREAEKTFGDGFEGVLERLANGDVVEFDGAVYVGFEEYRHSGSAFALCSNTGYFPDRQWDVIDLAGWVKWEERDLKGWLIVDEGLDRDGLIQAAKGSLNAWQAYVNGACYGYTVSIVHTLVDGYSKEVSSDSCWGFLGDFDGCRDEAGRTARALFEEVCDAAE